MPVLVAAVAIAAAFNAIDAAPVGVFYDDALYTILGKAIAGGHGYRYLNIPGQPAATHYPPGYPLLLALLWRVAPAFPANVALFKAVNAVLVGAVAAGAYWFGRERFGWPTWFAACVALAGTTAIPLLVLSSAVMSEVLFLALLFPWLMAAERTTVQSPPRRVVVVAALAGLLMYVRAHAIVLVPAFGIALVLARRRREALIALATGAAAILPWLLWVAANDAALPAPLRGSYGSYSRWLVDGVHAAGARLVAGAIHDNAITLVAIMARSFALASRSWSQCIAVLSVLALGGAGCSLMYRRARVTLLFLIGYFAIVLVWPFSPLRFAWGVWPFVIVVLAAGAAYDGRRTIGAVRLRALLRASAAIATLGMLWFNVRGYANQWWTTVSRPIAPRIAAQLQWLSSHSAARVATDDEGAAYLYTGVLAVPANVFTADQYFRRRGAAEDADHLAAIATTFGVDHVLAWSYPTINAATLLTVPSASRDALFVAADSLAGGGRVYARRSRPLSVP
ncbi:MAG TPA: hypothetical protein VJ867_10030 [Gemmatimonadaceae bacterium]|nr:hypothetical protein [Gemmatimonadaceae bacterium]